MKSIPILGWCSFGTVIHLVNNFTCAGNFTSEVLWIETHIFQMQGANSVFLRNVSLEARYRVLSDIVLKVGRVKDHITWKQGGNNKYYKVEVEPSTYILM